MVIKKCIDEGMYSGPLISVITNSYNSGKYLRANVESMLRQDYRNWEHIVIDCGSTDDSIDILSTLDHERLRIIQVPFCGVAEGRNIGIAQAKGSVIAILDSDDYALPARLSKQIGILLSSSDIAGVGSGIVRIDEMSSRRRTFVYPASHRGIATLLNAGLSPIPHSTLMFRLSSYEDIGGYSNLIEKAEDFEFIIRLMDSGQLRSLPETLVHCTYRENSHTQRHRPKGRDELFYVVLALILKYAEKGRAVLSQEMVERWLDSIGSDGIGGILGHWSITAMQRNIGDIGLNSITYLMKRATRSLGSILRCHREKWWQFSKTPHEIAIYLQSRNSST